jgi:hypothetical protein
MVDTLFARTEIRRIVATADDANPASMRVIEPLGFRFEGIARQAAHVRGECVDGVRFAILRDDRAAWVARVRTPPEQVELVELVYETSRPYAELVTHRYQEEFVAPMAVTFRHARMLIEQLRAEGHPRLMTSWGKGPGSPEPFYRSLGFEPTGKMIDDEVEAALPL